MIQSSGKWLAFRWRNGKMRKAKENGFSAHTTHSPVECRSSWTEWRACRSPRRWSRWREAIDACTPSLCRADSRFPSRQKETSVYSRPPSKAHLNHNIRCGNLQGSCWGVVVTRCTNYKCTVLLPRTSLALTCTMSQLCFWSAYEPKMVKMVLFSPGSVSSWYTYTSSSENWNSFQVSPSLVLNLNQQKTRPSYQ